MTQSAITGVVPGRTVSPAGTAGRPRRVRQVAEHRGEAVIMRRTVIRLGATAAVLAGLVAGGGLSAANAAGSTAAHTAISTPVALGAGIPACNDGGDITAC